MSTKPASMRLLAKYGWRTEQEIIDFLASVPNEKIKTAFDQSKSFLERRIDRLILSVDQGEEMVRGTKEMVAPGALFESLYSSHLEIKRTYKRAKDRLEAVLIKVGELQKESEG